MTMPSVGQTLREARFRAGLTLEQISNETRISVKNLRAIEEDELQQIPSKFFYVSFVRQIASRVGVKESDLDDSLRQSAARMPEPFQPGQMRTLLKRTLVSRQRSIRQWKTPIALTSFAAVMAVCTFFYSVWEDGDGRRTWRNRIESALTLHRTELRQGGTEQATSQTAKSTPESIHQPASSGGGKLAAPGRTTASSRFRAELAAIEPSWLSIEADGQQLFSGVLEPRETKVVEGGSARVRTGNAGGLKVVFNGHEMGVVGPRGQIRVVVFHKDAYEVLPSATASARFVKSFPEVRDWFMARASLAQPGLAE